MKFRWSTVWALGGVLAVVGCDGSPRQPLEQATRSIQRRHIDTHGRILASDAMSGRHFASAESESVAVYLTNTLQAAGIDAVNQASDLFEGGARQFAHTFGATLYRLGTRNKVVMLSRAEQQTLRLGQDFLPLLHARNDRITGNLVTFLGQTPVHESNVDLRGRIVLVGADALQPLDNESIEETLYRVTRQLEARGANAVAFAGLQQWNTLRTTRYVSQLPPDQIELARSPRGRRLNLHADRLVLQTQSEGWRLAPNGTIPAIVLAPGVWRAWRNGVEVGMVVDLQQEVSLDQSILVGFAGDDDARDVVLVLAHRDHAGVNAGGDILNGADDNASGVAALLELAPALRQVADDFASPVLLAFVSGELHGLQGTETLLRDFGLLFGERRIRCAVVLDGLGRHGSDHIEVHARQASAAQQRALQVHNDRASLFAPALLIAPPTPHATAGAVRQHPTSHELLEWAGIPSMLFNDGLDPYLYGQPEDDWKHIDTRKVARVARLIFRMTVDLAVQGEARTLPASRP